MAEVIWPFLADSIVMSVVESAIEDVDTAMGGYVSHLNLGIWTAAFQVRAYSP